MSKLIVMVGISGSGKTTLAKRIQTKDTVIVSADRIRQQWYGSDIIQGNGDLIFKALFERVVFALEYEHDVIVDNTSVTKQSRKYLLDIAEKYGAETFAILVECSVEQAMENQKGRERQVPINVIQSQYDRLEKSKHSLVNEFDQLIKYDSSDDSLTYVM